MAASIRIKNRPYFTSFLTLKNWINQKLLIRSSKTWHIWKLEIKLHQYNLLPTSSDVPRGRCGSLKKLHFLHWGCLYVHADGLRMLAIVYIDVFLALFFKNVKFKTINISSKLKMANICIFVTYGTRDVWDKKINK